MSSGSSGGAETHGSTSGSDIFSCSETSTEIESPLETPASELDLPSILPPRSPDSPTEPTPKIPYEPEAHRFSTVRPRAYFATYLPNEVISYNFGAKSSKLDYRDSDTQIEDDNYDSDIFRSLAKVSDHHRRGRSMATPRKRHRTKDPLKSPTQDACDISTTAPRELNNGLHTVSSLKRSHRPSPLDLSTISSRPASPLYTGQSPILRARCGDATPNAGYGGPLTAPLSDVVPLEAEVLPPLPATAPISILPKAPRIKPIVVSNRRSPSPLTLPSPKVSWSSVKEDSKHSMSLSGLLRTLPKGVSRLASGQRRKVSLSKQIADLQSSSVTSPIPPSLIKSPLLTHPASPFITGSPNLASTPNTPPTHSLLMSPGQPPNATPLRLHMNPYFSPVVLSNVGTRRISTSWPVQADSLLEQDSHYHNTNVTSHNLLDNYFATDVVDTGIY